MIEFSTPAAPTRPDLRNVADLLASRAAAAPDHVAFQVRDGDIWRDVTTRNFEDTVIAVAKGMVATGVQPGDAVAVAAPTRYEWAVVDLASAYAGAVMVPLYPTSSVSQAADIIRDSQPVLAVAGAAAHAELLRAACAEGCVGALPVWTMDPTPGADLDALVARGADVPDSVIAERRAFAGPDDVATIVYTSGTTRAAKGVIITHGNMVRESLSVLHAYPEVVNERANTLIFLPLSHILARTLQILSVHAGMRVAHLSDPTQVVATLAEIRPTFLVVVPRVLQKIQGGAKAKAEEKHLGKVFDAAIATAISWGRHLEKLDELGTAAPAPPWGLRLRHALFDRLFYAKLRTLTGGRLEWMLSGAAPLESHLSLFFRGLGLPVIEGYGLTETTAPCTGNLPGRIRSGTVGPPVPGTTLRIAEDGEVLVKGIGVSPGYRDPADNEGAFVDGFFRTGDLGSLDEKGYLTLSGRVKDIIVTASGKNVVPAPWENAVEADPMVAYAIMVGDGKPFPAALILMARDEVAAWAERHGHPALATLARDPLARNVEDPNILAQVGAVVARANQAVSRAEQVRKFKVLLTDLKEESGHFTPTMKLKRSAFLHDFADTIEELYRTAPGRKGRA
ncbi:MAG: AMP-dependent synthetase/ligase [Actinomycetota bacterium]